MRGPGKQYQGYVLAIGVTPKLRHQGWGKLLLDEGIQELKKQQRRYTLEWVRLTVAATNTPAISLFEAAGFRPTPNEVEHYQDGQRAISMRRPLD